MPRPSVCLAVFFAAVAGSGCAQFPELDRAITPEGQSAPPPELLPIDPLLTSVPEGRAEGVEEAVLGRADALRAEGADLAARGGDADAAESLAARRARLMQERARLTQ